MWHRRLGGACVQGVNLSMIPDFPTIARRRHIATMIVRSCIVAYAAWAIYKIVPVLWSVILGAMQGGGWVYFQNVGVVPVLMCVLALVFFGVERWVVRWIVPLPAREQACPKCGYSLKNLKSPICPECGTDLN